MKLLVQLDKLEGYWQHMLAEYPNHPAGEKIKQSAPLSLYGCFDDLSNDFVCNWVYRHKPQYWSNNIVALRLKPRR